MYNSIYKKVKTLINEFRYNDFRETVSRDLQDSVDYYLNEDQKKRLSQSGFIKRNMLKSWWLLKSLFQKLTVTKQVLLIIGLVLILSHTFQDKDTIQIPNNIFIGALFILFVLLLELKDKLVAESELNEGKAVQNALMPQNMPNIKGWDIWFYSKPATEVGGDLVDFIRISGKRFALILADISGKGLGAALLMVKLQSIIRTLVADFTSPDALVNKVNNVFYRDSLKKSFASLIYLELQPDSSSIKIVNAGHLPPSYISGPLINELPKGNQAIGLSKNVSYQADILNLNSADTLFIYSDGLTEAVNEDGEFFESRLNALLPSLVTLSAEECGKKIVEIVENFIGSARIHDDLSLIVLKKI